MFFASMYALPNATWVVVLRLHVSACDRTTAVSLLRELLLLTCEGEGGEEWKETGNKDQEVCLGIGDLIPSGKAKKPLWARGVDMLSYSVSSLRLTNLKFKDPRSPRSSQVVRLQMNEKETQKIIAVILLLRAFITTFFKYICMDGLVVESWLKIIFAGLQIKRHQIMRGIGSSWINSRLQL